MRLIVTFLSIGTLIAYGYALAGLGGYLVGKGHLSYIIWGLLLGTFSAIAAIFLWHRHAHEFYMDDE